MTRVSEFGVETTIASQVTTMLALPESYSVPIDDVVTTPPVSSTSDVTTPFPEKGTTETEPVETETSLDIGLETEDSGNVPEPETTDPPTPMQGDVEVDVDLSVDAQELPTPTPTSPPETTFTPVLEPVLDPVLETTLAPSLSPAEYIANADDVANASADADDVYEFHVGHH